MQQQQPIKLDEFEITGLAERTIGFELTEENIDDLILFAKAIEDAVIKKMTN